MSFNKSPRFRISVSYTENHPDGFYWAEEEKSFLWFKYWSEFDAQSKITTRATIEFDDQGTTNFVGTKEFAVKLIEVRKRFIKEAAERAAKLAKHKKLGAHRKQYIDY